MVVWSFSREKNWLASDFERRKRRARVRTFPVFFFFSNLLEILMELHVEVFKIRIGVLPAALFTSTRFSSVTNVVVSLP